MSEKSKSWVKVEGKCSERDGSSRLAAAAEGGLGLVDLGQPRTRSMSCWRKMFCKMNEKNTFFLGFETFNHIARGTIWNDRNTTFSKKFFHEKKMEAKWFIWWFRTVFSCSAFPFHKIPKKIWKEFLRHYPFFSIFSAVFRQLLGAIFFHMFGQGWRVLSNRRPTFGGKSFWFESMANWGLLEEETSFKFKQTRCFMQIK